MIRTLRRSGISVPLFSLRSTRSWGIGEIGDIPFFADWLTAAGQSALQILPLNEVPPEEASPYSALSAMAIDPQFISIWMMGGAARFEGEWRQDLEHVRSSPRIDYAIVRRLKTRALKALFDEFLATEWQFGTTDAAALQTYIASESWWLDDYSLYRALREREARPWIEWTAELRDRASSALSVARRELSREVLFFQYVQWVAASQWQKVRQGTRNIQILGDFPFMVTLDSADVWSRRDDFMLDASVGTPPDAFSETGQEWGLPPYDWAKARSNDFSWLRMRTRRQAALYDGFRVDHLVGFYRTYIRPLDKRSPYFLPPDEDDQRELGETVLGMMLETGCDVSVEDLGTVPDFVRESIARLGVPGYKVLRWEAAAPAAFPPQSVAMTGTHDTETLAVWWESLRPEEQERFAFVSARFEPAVRDLILRRMIESGSNLVLLPVQDVFGWRDRINHPATISPMNWTYVLPWPVDRMNGQPDARERAARLLEWAKTSQR